MKKSKMSLIIERTTLLRSGEAIIMERAVTPRGLSGTYKETCGSLGGWLSMTTAMGV